MNYRIATILAEKSLDAAGTETIDINVKEPISRIDIRYKNTKSKFTMDGHPAKDITKIELVDGSDVLHGLSGYENQALCIYDRKVPTMCHGQHTEGDSEESEYGIDFGRYLWDMELAFDPKRFTNPQLKVTYNSKLADTGATSPLLEVFGHLFDEKVVSPLGFLMAKEQYNASCPAEDSYKYVDLPIDFPVRRMIIRGFHEGHEPWDSVKEVRLDEDNSKRIPIDWKIEEYHRVMKGVWTPVEELILAAAGIAGNAIYVTPTDYLFTALAMGTNATYPVYAPWDYPGGKVTFWSTEVQLFKGVARGYLPNHCIDFPFGIQGDLNDWYDVTKVGSLRLRIKGGSSGATGVFQAVLQQLRRY